MPVSSVDHRAFVYVIGARTGALKIGVAENCDARLMRLQDGNPRVLTVKYRANFNRAEAFVVEGATHEILSLHRVRGEWFDVSLRQAVGAIQQVLKTTGIREDLFATAPVRVNVGRRHIQGLQAAAQALGIRNTYERAKEDPCWSLLIGGGWPNGSAYYVKLRAYFEEKGFRFDERGRVSRHPDVAA
jgi:T5orf172 domain